MIPYTILIDVRQHVPVVNSNPVQHKRSRKDSCVSNTTTHKYTHKQLQMNIDKSIFSHRLDYTVS